MPSCLVCSHANEEGAEYCEECGVKLGTAPSPETPTATDDAPIQVRPRAPAASGGNGGEAGVAAAAGGGGGAAAGAQSAGAPQAGDTVAFNCPSCQTPIPAGSQFCSRCGTAAGAAPSEREAPAPSAGRQCPSCGTQAEAGAAFCAKCGSRLSQTAAAPRPRGEAIRLRVVAGKEKDRVYDVEKKEIRIGRHPDNDIPLEMDGYVSGKHTLILKEGTEYFIEDMGSTNGTFIRVRSRVKVQPGDEFKIGQSIFRLEE